jgi:hypothetical protein
MTPGSKPPRTPPPAVHWPHSGPMVSQARLARPPVRPAPLPSLPPAKAPTARPLPGPVQAKMPPPPMASAQVVQCKCKICGAGSHSAATCPQNPEKKVAAPKQKSAEEIRQRMAGKHHQKTGASGTPKKRLEKWKLDNLKAVEDRLKQQDDKKDNGGAGGGISVLVSAT